MAVVKCASERILRIQMIWCKHELEFFDALRSVEKLSYSGVAQGTI